MQLWQLVYRTNTMLSRPTNTGTPPHPSSLESGLLQSIMQTILCVLWMQWGSNLSDSVPLSEQMADCAQYLWLSFPFKEKSSLSLSLCGYLLKTATDSNGWVRHFSTKTAMAEQGTSQQKWVNRALHNRNGWREHFKTLAQKTAMKRALQDTGTKDSNGWTGHFTPATDEQGTSRQRCERLGDLFKISNHQVQNVSVTGPSPSDRQPDDKAYAASTAHYMTTSGVSSGRRTLMAKKLFGSLQNLLCTTVSVQRTEISSWGIENAGKMVAYTKSSPVMLRRFSEIKPQQWYGGYVCVHHY